MGTATFTRTLMLFAACGLVGCATRQPPAPLDPALACEALKAPIAASLIELPTKGVLIDTATFTPPEAARVVERAPTPAAAVFPALPEMCRVVGRILPIDPSAPPIIFQVNLPTQWNGKSLQLGGGGFNGTLITGLQHPPAMPFGSLGPLARGYVTIGTDSGHQTPSGTAPQAFATNKEALENFAHASYKKVKDVAMELIALRYGQRSSKHYFAGSSEGGREALTMAQRYPRDFDGVYARVPVINWTGLQHAYLPPNFLMLEPGGWLSPAHVALVANYVVALCDADDGAADGIVSDSKRCSEKLDFASLRCSSGQAEQTCLNDAQTRAAKSFHAPYRFEFALAHGVRSYPGRPLGGEGTPGPAPMGGWVGWLTGNEPPAQPGVLGKHSTGWVYGSGTIAHFILRDGNADVRNYNPRDHAGRVLEISNLMDSTDPDLSAFHARGGKVIVLEYMGDFAQSPYAGIEYFQSVQRKMGEQKTGQFFKLFTAPGVDHVGTGAPGNVDMLAALEDWVERGTPPNNLTVIEQNNAPPFAPRRSRPLCEWPLVPKYSGKGNAQVAASFGCVKP